ncbi:MAG: peptidase M22 [Firmicutes bacterium]|nr:peptidase M22 [Alicyclobacillaceae bacterium]MCL6496676.1 peptidase M22 [Bacillota bacterium]
MIRGAVLGVDTSAYTTSLAVVTADGVRADLRRTLPVAPGARGLRPSEAVFHHLQQLPELFATLTETVPAEEFVAVAVSARPRPMPEAYLPQFAVGVGYARVLARALGIPCYATSHQEGHIRAAVGFGEEPPPHFFALHLSGGTTELLDVRRRAAYGFAVEAVGVTADLYAGQLVDRVGVALGLPFPAGPALERLAAERPWPPPASFAAPRREGHRWRISLSGPEAEILRRKEQGWEPAAVAALVEATLAEAIGRWVEVAVPPGPLWVVGGVAANRRLRAAWEARWTARGFSVRYAPVELSRDNAVGVAALGWDAVRAGAPPTM